MSAVPKIEVIVFAAGLAIAATAGVASYQRHGIYGDGPGGSGFWREPDPVTGMSRLVHESMTSQGLLRRIFARSRHNLIEVELDRDNDGNVDECVKVENGRIAGIGFSTKQDGIIDAWVYRDANGQIARVEISTKRNHRVDRWEYYDAGALTHVAVDANGDGRPD